MRCLFCNSSTKVVDKRDAKDYVRRRRECLKCKRRFTTHEVYLEPKPKIIQNIKGKSPEKKLEKRIWIKQKKPLPPRIRFISLRPKVTDVFNPKRIFRIVSSILEEHSWFKEQVRKKYLGMDYFVIEIFPKKQAGLRTFIRQSHQGYLYADYGVDSFAR